MRARIAGEKRNGEGVASGYTFLSAVFPNDKAPELCVDDVRTRRRFAAPPLMMCTLRVLRIDVEWIFR